MIQTLQVMLISTYLESYFIIAFTYYQFCKNVFPQNICLLSLVKKKLTREMYSHGMASVPFQILNIKPSRLKKQNFINTKFTKHLSLHDNSFRNCHCQVNYYYHVTGCIGI